MKLGILSRNSGIYSTSRLVEEAEKRGHEVEVINYPNCYMNMTSTQSEVHYQERVLSDFDAVIPRIGASKTFYGTAVVRQFEAMGVYSINSAEAILNSRDKLRAHQIFASKSLPMPTTGFADSTKNTKDLIKLVGGAPLIIKLLEGTQGGGVVLAETNKAAESVMSTLRGLRAHFIIQKFIKEADNKDIRCIVLNNRVVAAMERVAKDGEYRANLHMGGDAIPVELTGEEEQIAIRAAEILGIGCGGVDLIRSENGPLVLEVNSSPGLKGIEAVTGVNIAGEIIKKIESVAC